MGGKSWTVGKESGGCDAGLAVQTQPETVADDSNGEGGCGRSSTFGGSGPALTQAQKSACITAFNKALTFQQCSALGGIWGGLPPNIDGRTGLCGWRYKWLIGG